VFVKIIRPCGDANRVSHARGLDSDVMSFDRGFGALAWQIFEILDRFRRNAALLGTPRDTLRNRMLRLAFKPCGPEVRPIAFALAVFSVTAAVSFHSNFADQNQMIHFLKDVMLAGGLLQIVAFGPGAISVEQWRRKIGTPSGAEAVTV
jgi:hypothetical protein